MTEQRPRYAVRKLTDDEAFKANFQAIKPGITMEQSTEYYNGDGADLYEEYLSPERYRGPVIAAETVTEFFTKVDKRSNPVILDFAAGTGFVGEELYKRGFRELDSLEPSEKMLEIAKKKNIFKRNYCNYLDTNRLPIDDNTYDCAVSSGGFANGHIPPEGLYELVRIVKPGGVITIVTREKYLHDVPEYKDRLEPLMMDMQRRGLWRLRQRKIVADYAGVGSCEGIVLEYIVC